MGNTSIQTNLVSPGQSTGLQNLTDNLMEIFKGLVQTYIPGIPHFYKGLRPFESESVQLPCVLLQPVEVQAKMSTTAKYEKWYPFDLWFAVGADSVDDAVVKCTDVGEIFAKLFSNNALNDRGVANSNQFKTYGTNWVDSDMSKISYGIPFLFGRQGAAKYCALGCFQLKIQTQKLV